MCLQRHPDVTCNACPGLLDVRVHAGWDCGVRWNFFFKRINKEHIAGFPSVRREDSKGIGVSWQGSKQASHWQCRTRHAALCHFPGASICTASHGRCRRACHAAPQLTKRQQVCEKLFWRGPAAACRCCCTLPHNHSMSLCDPQLPLQVIPIHNAWQAVLPESPPNCQPMHRCSAHELRGLLMCAVPLLAACDVLPHC